MQLGRPGAPFALFDLIVTTPESRLPVRPNVLHVAAPLLEDEGASGVPAELGDLPRPWTLLVAGGDIFPYVMDQPAARADRSG